MKTFTHESERSFALALGDSRHRSLYYGSLRWFRLALRWKTPCHCRVNNHLSELILQQNVVVNTVEEIQLPLTFLLSSKMGRSKLGREYSILSRAVHLSRLQVTKVVFQRWAESHHRQEATVRDDAAVHIQRLSHRYDAKIRSKNINLKWFEFAGQRGKRLHTYKMIVQSKGRQLVRFIVACKMNHGTTSCRVVQAAISTVKRALRARTPHGSGSVMLAYTTRSQSSILLQSVFRGAQIRKNTWKVKQCGHHEIIQSRYQTAERSTRYNFEQQGAAKLIQVRLTKRGATIGTAQVCSTKRLQMNAAMTLIARNSVLKKCRASSKKRGQFQVFQVKQTETIDHTAQSTMKGLISLQSRCRGGLTRATTTVQVESS
mmetsp:Transcript_30047/g.92932  ORF Transcript_30047/g.92932 Transcript_30047/m.92932 type:complete len:374 (+) Transcript_30047:251-1372(+)